MELLAFIEIRLPEVDLGNPSDKVNSHVSDEHDMALNPIEGLIIRKFNFRSTQFEKISISSESHLAR